MGTDTTDRELLEWAAKAAGQERSAAGDLWSNARGRLWDPLGDDGDALRLAVKLRITLTMREGGCMATDLYLIDFYQRYDNDATAATRHAIVQVAAEIGRTDHA